MTDKLNGAGSCSAREPSYVLAGGTRTSKVNEERRTLLQSLNYKPQDLKFGTSGRRGLLVDLSQLEVYIVALGDLEYLQSLPVTEGGIKKGEEFFFAYDLRPSSTAY
jgi:phosphomannomutase